jgi:hypothetical protein
MNNLAIKRMTVPEFLAWAETQENPRFELIDGQPVAMAPERSEHVQAKLWAATALGAAIQSAGVACQAFVDGLAVAQLKSRSRATWLTEALVRIAGLRGLMAGASVIGGLVERYWDGVFPMPDEHGMETRVAAVAGLSGQGADGTSCITASKRTGPSRSL